MKRDDRVDELVGAFLQRIQRGERPDPEEVLRAAPDLADALRERLAVVMRLDAVFGPRAVDGARGDLVGRRLGAYRLTSLLGSGGMGSVYLATPESSERPPDAPARVAVKVVHPQFLARAGSAERFRREAELGRRVRHPNVVRTLDAGDADCGGSRRHYLVMEHVDGRTLRDLADELGGRVPEQLCRHIGREIAQGLAALHAAGAVHRDLKPENVIIMPSHDVKVMDLGVAWLADEAVRLSQTGAFVGSLLYGAPEQLHAGQVDGRADLHALGLLLHELAAGEHPFAADDFRAIVRRLLDEKPRRLGLANPQISPFLEELVANLLEKDPDRRPSSAAEVATILDQGEESAWWKSRALALRRETRRPLRRIRIQRETALYGRDSEISRLRVLFAKAKAGDGQVVLVEGEAGIGKSRLVDELALSLWADGEDIDFLFGGYPPGGAASAAGAFATAYREHLGDDADAVREALPQTPLLVPAFAALLRGELPPDGLEKPTKDSIQTLFVHATRSFAARRTTIVFIDDLHFAPDEGRALFASIALAASDRRILLVGGARRSLDETWAAAMGRLPHATRLPLDRLGAKDLVELLADALKSEHLATELAGKIAQKSDGNPFFVFEILRGLREGQFLTKKPDGTWITTRAIQEIDVPPSIVDVIHARVSDLDSGERNALEVASCVGFEFDAAVVGAVLDVAPIPLLQRLGQIEKAHRLVRSVGRRFAFDHHQVQEVLYAGLSPPLREAYHAAIAEAIETRSGAASREPKDLDGALCVDLAEHLLRGARGERALRYLDAALTHLESRWLNDAAARLCDRALAASGLLTGGERVRLLLRLASRLDLLGRFGPQRAAAEEALALAREIGDRQGEVRAAGQVGVILNATARSAEALKQLERSLALAAEIGDEQGTVRTLAHLTIVFSRLGRYAEAWDHAERCLALARRLGFRASECAAIGNLAEVLLAWERFAEAREHYERQLALAREIGDRRSESRATVNLGIVLRRLDRCAEAREHCERALALSQEIGDRRGEVDAIAVLGGLLWSQGHYAEARPHYERVLALVREFGDRRGESYAEVNLGVLFRSMGRFDEARAHLDRGLSIARDIDNRRTEADALAEFAAIACESDDASLAERLFAESVGINRVLGARAEESESLLARGALLIREGRAAEARADFDAALATARELGSLGVEVVASAYLARLPEGAPRDRPQDGLASPGAMSAAALAAVDAHGERVEAWMRMEARFVLWQATHDAAHLAEAKRLLDFLLEHATPECRETMLTNVRLHREIVAAWRAESASDAAPDAA
jgi:serine/threonine protein kinase/predicted ATPase